MSDSSSDLEAKAAQDQKQTTSSLKSFLSGGVGGISAVLVGM